MQLGVRLRRMLWMGCGEVAVVVKVVDVGRVIVVVRAIRVMGLM